MLAKRSKVLLVLLCILVLLPGSGAAAQSPAPSPSSATTATPAPPTATLTPTPTHSPVAVLIVTPAATATPFSPLPPEVRAALAFIRAAGWWLVPFVLLAVLLLLTRRVGGELLDTWAKGIAAALEDWRVNQAARFLPGPSPHERALLEDIIKNYAKLEIKNIVRTDVVTASLESIYMPLFTQGAGEGKQLLRGGELRGLMARDETGEPVKLSTLLPLHRCLVITAGAGAGKSTFLRHVALTLARAILERQPALLRQRLDWELTEVPLPIFVPLGGFGAYLNKEENIHKDAANPDLILGYMRYYFRDRELPDDFFEERLKRAGQTLVLLDGLDEVAHFADRVLISDTVTRLARRYEGTRFVVTCRPEGYQDNAQLGEEFYRANIDPLRWPDDIAPFVKRWNEAVLQAGSHAAEDNTQDFLRRLEGQPRVRELADNPLLLTVMIIVHFNIGELPERRAKLYDKATEILLSWDTSWRRELVAPPPWLCEIEVEERRLYLEKLAYHWQERGTIEMPRAETAQFLLPLFCTGQGAEKSREAACHADDFLDWVVERAYLLRPLGNMLSFYRRAFQEYLAARRLASSTDIARTTIAALDEDWDWWEETVLLTVDHLSANYPEKAVELLRALLAEDAQPQEALLQHRYLVLAARALADAARAHLDWQLVTKVKDGIVDAISTDNPAFPVPLRVHAGDALAALGDTRPGVRDTFPLVVEVPGGNFPMGSTPEEVQRWKDWTEQALDDGRYAVPENMSKEAVFKILTAWLDAEAGVYEIAVPTFYIARYPVTNAQFAPFVDSAEGGYNNSEFWTAAGWAWRQGEGEGWGRAPAQRAAPMYWTDSRFNRPNQPVVGITWYEAVAYARWLTHKWRAAPGELYIWREGAAAPLDVSDWDRVEFRLPTEAEWEKAARGTDGRTWSWGTEFDTMKANTGEDDIKRTTAVGLYPGGASPYGALDMIGNVWEWTSTRWGDNGERSDYTLPYRADDGREDLVGTSRRVVRGGSWSNDQSYARCAYRDGYNPNYWRSPSGLRLALSPVFSGC